MIEFTPAGLLVLSYLAGGVPTGYIVVKRLKGFDIRTKGSGNPGAANVYRNAGALAGAVTLCVDAFKGFLPVWLSLRLAPGRDWLALSCGAAAIVGHNWTVFLGLRGGKGVATSAGVFAALMPAPLAASAAVFAAGAGLTGHISVGSMGAAAALPLLGLAWGAPRAFVWAAAAAAALILYKHVPNIKRLLQNRELGIHGPSA